MDVRGAPAASLPACLRSLEVGMSAQSCRYLLSSSRHVSVFKSPPCSSPKG